MPNGEKYFPKLYFGGLDGKFNILIMELLGPSLEEIIVKMNGKLSLKSVVNIGE